MGLRQITAPATMPVTREEMKAHLRVDVDDDNDMIDAMTEAAVDYCDGPTGFLGRALIDQTWELVLDEFPDDEIKIPMPPLIEVVSIKYDDGDGTEQTMSTSDYTVDNVSEPGWVLPVSGTWPTTFDGVNAVRIQFRCGYVDSGSPVSENVPGAIKAAIKLIVGNLYQNRETIVLGQTVAQIPMSAEFLLRKHRIHLSMA